MVEIIILSHGELCKALISTAEMILGRQDDITAIGCGADENMNTFKERVQKAFCETNSKNKLVLTDLFGGSPCNIALQLTMNENVTCITGMNLPMLLVALAERENSSVDELAEKCVNVGKDGILLANLQVKVSEG
ncbi:MAG: PTS sugar transporter subunit IIA [Lachnospiraceae bacterium]|jgi:mannose/fructose/sorbose-specific phosphotransferase system IIA component